MTFVWKNIGGEEGGRVAPQTAVIDSGSGEKPPTAEGARMLDGRPILPPSSQGGFYNGPVTNPVSGSICSPVSLASSRPASEEGGDFQPWGWDPNKSEERVVIDKSSGEVQAAFLVDEADKSEDLPRCTAFNGVVNSSEKSSFNTSYDSGVFDSYDSGVNADDNSVVE